MADLYEEVKKSDDNGKMLLLTAFQNRDEAIFENLLKLGATIDENILNNVFTSENNDKFIDLLIEENYNRYMDNIMNSGEPLRKKSRKTVHFKSQNIMVIDLD
jgi:hypothetical protein